MGVGSLLSETYFGSTILDYVLFFAILSAGAVLGRALSYGYELYLESAAASTTTEFDDILVHALGKPVILLGIVGGAVVGQGALTLVAPVESALNTAIEILVVVLITWTTVRLTDSLISTYIGRYAMGTESKLDDALVPIVNRMMNIAIISIGAIVILDSIGYNINAIIASLGIGGIAIAFASRRALADVFGGVHILASKPFLVDDIVEIGGTVGTVEEIGLRTTQLRDFDGRLITIPNSNVAKVEVKNITAEPSRRISMKLGLSYDTTPTEMTEAVDLAVETANSVDGVDPEETEAWFWEYGDSALQIRLDYFIDDLDDWRGVKHEVNQELHVAFEDAGFDMAFPTRTVHVDSTVSSEPAEVVSSPTTGGENEPIPED